MAAEDGYFAADGDSKRALGKRVGYLMPEGAGGYLERWATHALAPRIEEGLRYAAGASKRAPSRKTEVRSIQGARGKE